MQPRGEFDPVRSATRLLHEARTGALATLAADGAPHASLVTVGTLPDASPVLLLSRLARHTGNIRVDPRVCLLVDERRADDPLQGARVSLYGRIAETADPAARRRFLARHPAAEAYADFADFGFWRIKPSGAHLVAGFGRIIDLADRDLLIEVGDAGALLAAEASAVAHMNENHAETLALYATRLLGAPPGPWRVIAVDPLGCDLMLADEVRRLDFPHRITTPGALRKIFVELSERAGGHLNQG